jgi:hypothetical protein
VSSRNLALEQCIFSSCRDSYFGGALYLGSSSPFINITRCRFENNYASYRGYDIYVDTSSCFSESDIITDSCTTSTSTTSVFCSSFSKALLTTCDYKIVLLHILFFFFLNIYMMNEYYLCILYNFVVRIGVIYQMRNVRNFV